ncbi:MAG TPA: ThuA domain-containing protein [Anaeromyxobacter sp.]
MPPFRRPAAWLGVACLLGAATAAACADDRREVIVYTRTLGFRHASIPAAVAAMKRAAAAEGLSVRVTESPTAFTPEALRRAAAVVFLLTTGEVPDARGQEALQAYVRAGGGFLGVHSAADTGHAWPWYLDLVGAEFLSHPPVQPAVLVREDGAHPATADLPERWSRTDEWYDFRASPRGRVHVLLSIDEASYQGGLMGADHPMAWCHVFEGGRAAYTALGHTAESWSEPLFLAHVRGALRWVAGLAEGDCAP